MTLYFFVGLDIYFHVCILFETSLTWKWVSPKHEVHGVKFPLFYCGLVLTPSGLDTMLYKIMHLAKHLQSIEFQGWYGGIKLAKDTAIVHVGHTNVFVIDLKSKNLLFKEFILSDKYSFRIFMNAIKDNLSSMVYTEIVYCLDLFLSELFVSMPYEQMQSWATTATANPKIASTEAYLDHIWM